MRLQHHLGHIARLAACLLLWAAACGPALVERGFQPGQLDNTDATATKRVRATATNRARASAAPSSTSGPSSSGCLDATEISLDHAGQAICVTGTVTRVFNTEEASYVDVGTDFYLLSYDVDLSGIEPSSCLTISGEIKRLGSKPVIVVARTAPPADCASGQALLVGSFAGTIVSAPPTVPPTPQPADTQPPPPPPTQVPPPPNCHPSYPGVCIPWPPPDLDCDQVPYSNFRVVGDDPHRFDGDNDGIGCEG